jgi:hypothetical protein
MDPASFGLAEVPIEPGPIELAEGTRFVALYDCSPSPRSANADGTTDQLTLEFGQTVVLQSRAEDANAEWLWDSLAGGGLGSGRSSQEDGYFPSSFVALDSKSFHVARLIEAGGWPPPPTDFGTARAAYDFDNSLGAHFLQFKEGDVLRVLERTNREWWRGALVVEEGGGGGATDGFFPYIRTEAYEKEQKCSSGSSS